MSLMGNPLFLCPQKIRVPKHPYSLNPLAQSETSNQLKNLTDHKISSMAVEDIFFRYLRLFLLSKYVNAAKMTNSSVSISSVFIPTSFPFPERTTADYPYLL